MMKLSRLVVLSVAASIGAARAATYTWTGGAGDGKFSSAANWDGAPSAFTEEDTCVFNNAAALSVTLDSEAAVGTLSFAGAGAVTLGGTATLTVTKVASSSAAAHVLNCPVAFSGGYLVDFATAAVDFAGGATATFPSTASTDNAASHTLVGEIRFTEDWNSPKVAYPWIVPSGSKVFGKLVTGTASAVATANTNPSALIMRVEEGGYAEFEKFIGGETGNRARISVWGRFKVGVWQAGVAGDKGNSHIGFDGDESHNGVIEAEGVHKYSNYQVYLKNPVLYVGAQGIGAKVQDYTIHFNGCPKTIYATADFEVFGPVNTGNLVDWGIALDVDASFDTQGHTVTWTGGATGSGALVKNGEGALVMKPHGCDFTKGVTVNGGRLVIANSQGVGAAPIALASGATLEFANPDMTTVAGATTAADGATISFHLDGGRLQGRLGRLVPPANGVVKIKITGDPVAGRAYEITCGANLQAADLAKFAVEGRDDLALSISSTGDLAFTADGSSATPGRTFTYAAGSAEEAVWSTAVAAWTTEGVTGKTPFEAGGNAVFQGGIAAAAASVKVDEDIAVGDLTIDTPADVVLGGTGTLGGLGKVTKRGAGNLTLDGANFDAQEFEIAQGKVTLGMNAGAHSLGIDSGTGGGKVTILDGAQFNLNSTNTVGNNTDVRMETTQLKTFAIAGAGPDGRGAIVNDSLDGRTTHNDAWTSSFRRIELAGDATIGGTDRFDVRVRSGTAATAAGGIFGRGKTLTVKNSGYFGLIELPIDVQAVVVSDGGTWRPEAMAETNFRIPGGIMLDNGTLHGRASTYPAFVPINVGAGGGTIYADYQTTTFNGPVNVAEGAALALQGGSVLTFVGGIANNGAVTVEAGTHSVTGGNLAGDGSWKLTGGSLCWHQNVDLVSPKTPEIAGGTFFYGKETSGLGKLNQKMTVNMTGGAFAFNIGATATITQDDVEINGGKGIIRFYGKDDPSVVVRLEGIKATVDTIGTSDQMGNANYTLGPGVDLAATTFLVNQSSNGKGSTVRVEEGASLTVGDNLTIGDGAGANEYRMVVEGGRVVCQGTSPLHMAYQANAGYLDFLSGEMEVPGIWCRIGWFSPLTHDEKFTMDGGTLSITGAHATNPAIGGYTRFKPFIQFNNGRIVSLGNWTVDQMLAVSFGDRAGGHVELDVADKTVDWRTGLIGAADVTLKGSGSFKSGVGVADYMRFQGAATGAWTVENAGVNDLYGSSGFLGGLHLKENVAANIRIGGSNLVEAVFLKTGSGKFTESCTWSNAYPFACNDLTLLHAKGNVEDYSNAVLMWQGQFYADTAGTWTFAGGYDDSVRIDVDGKRVMEHATWNTVTSGTVDLSVGWHDFRIVQYQAGGGWGTVPGGWANVMNVGFAKSAVGNTDAANYARFDGDNLPLRPGPVTGAGGEVNWHVVHQKDDWNTRTDWTFESVTNNLSMLDVYNLALPETIGNSVHMFDGWVFVPAAKAGDWAVYADFDDRASLRIDGVDSGATGDNNAAAHNGSIPGVTPGWHRFEMRVCDTGGNWGPWGGTTGQAKNPAITITVNGATYNFNEKNFRFSASKPVEYAGLDGVVRLDAGSTLSNRAAKACPVWGALAGTGTLAGPFAFAGEKNSWNVTGAYNNRELACVKFADPSRETFLGLKEVKAVFDAKPVCSAYFLLGAEVPGLSAADLADVKVSVTDGVKDYSAKFSLGVSNGRLALLNRTPGGMLLYVR
ncbi:MAG: hypothetical protein IKL96_02845 [Kiritimatiellae bacterium]|nr:hypothetical protein [Kiritimatiellia bacterium]